MSALRNGARQGNLSPQVRTCEALARQLVYLYQMGEGVQINTQDVLPRNDRFALFFGALHRFQIFFVSGVTRIRHRCLYDVCAKIYDVCGRKTWFARLTMNEDEL